MDGSVDGYGDTTYINVHHKHTHAYLDQVVQGLRHRDQGEAQKVEERERREGRGGVERPVLDLDPEKEGGEGDLVCVCCLGGLGG